MVLPRHLGRVEDFCKFDRLSLLAVIPKSMVFRIICSLVFFVSGWGFLLGQIVNIEDRRAKLDTIGWFGQLDLGGQYTRKATEVLTLNGGFRLDRLAEKNHWLLLGDYRVVRANGNNFLNAAFGHLRYGVVLGPNWEWEVFTQLQYDERIRLSLRSLLGTGPRLRLVEGKRGDLFLGIIYMFEYDELSNDDRVFRDHRISSYLSLHWSFPGGARLANITYYQPRLPNFNRTRISTSTTLAMPLGKRLSFTTRFNLTYDARINQLFVEVPKSTFVWSNGLRWKF